MYRAIIISPDADLSRSLQARLADLGGIAVVRSIDRYPDELELSRMLRAHAPQIAFVGIASMTQAAHVAAILEANAPGIQVVAIHHSCEQQVLLEILRLGIRDFLAMPFTRDEVRDVLSRLAENLSKRPVGIHSSDLLFTFLPSKAGVGTTTLAVNTAIALAAVDDTKTLLADFDLGSGLVQFMLKLENGHGVPDAAEHAAEMDENLWPQLVTPLGSLDVLHAGALNPHFRIDRAQLRYLLEFARRNYRVLCADLSGNLEQYSLELMHESRRVLLVCTPELPSLHLAREKLRWLKDRDLADRVTVLLNRATRRALISTAEIEALLGATIFQTFPNDYLGVHRALTEGRPVDSASELGRQFGTLARTLLDRKAAVEPAKRRFVEYFALTPARYSLGRRTG